jgi:hypothetical protein
MDTQNQRKLRNLAKKEASQKEKIKSDIFTLHQITYLIL